MTLMWVQKATDGLACKLWNHCTQCANKYIPMARAGLRGATEAIAPGIPLKRAPPVMKFICFK